MKIFHSIVLVLIVSCPLLLLAQESGCPEELQIHSINNTQLIKKNYTASRYIEGTATISPNSKIQLTAGKEVVLTNGFWSKERSELLVGIQQCKQENRRVASSRAINSVSSNIHPTNRSKDSEQYLRNFPNPFSIQTTIEFRLKTMQSVTLSIVDSSGKLIQQLLTDEPMQAGKHRIPFYTKTQMQGIYFYQLITPTETLTGKMTLVK